LYDVNPILSVEPKCGDAQKKAENTDSDVHILLVSVTYADFIIYLMIYTPLSEFLQVNSIVLGKFDEFIYKIS
jgi:hypothetical protein